MLNVYSLILVLLAVAACTGVGTQAATAAQKADPIEDLSFAALEKRQALGALRKEVIVDRAKWPKGEVRGLDFTKETGNAIIVHAESGRLNNPLSTLTNAVPFKLFHIEDDPYRLALAARGIGLAKPEDKAKYRTGKYRPALEHIARAKYVLFVVGELEEPRIDLGGKSFTPARLEGAGVLYEIGSKTLLGGFPVAARNSSKITTRTGDYTGQALDAVMHDFEKNAREVLWKELKARFPSAKIPTIVYLDSKE
jgi:hypothetical protein